MSEKRFKLSEIYSNQIIDTGNCVNNGTHCRLYDLKECVDLLNEQQSTISSLQTELELTANTKLFSRKELEKKVEEQQAEIERLQKIIDLTQYQLKVQDRILKEVGE